MLVFRVSSKKTNTPLPKTTFAKKRRTKTQIYTLSTKYHTLPMCVRDERVCLSRVPSRLPYVRTLSLERDALRAVEIPSRARSRPPKRRHSWQRRGRHRPRSVHSFRPPMPAMKTAKSHCSGSSGMRTWLGLSLGLGLGLRLGIGIGIGLGMGNAAPWARQDRQP